MVRSGLNGRSFLHKNLRKCLNRQTDYFVLGCIQQERTGSSTVNYINILEVCQ